MVTVIGTNQEPSNAGGGALTACLRLALGKIAGLPWLLAVTSTVRAAEASYRYPDER
jgi:hypothetical protein